MKTRLTVIRSFLLLLTLGHAHTAMATHVATHDEQMANEILVYINQYRMQHGLPKLIMNQELIKEATQHSHEMAIHAMPFGHNGFQRRIAHLHHHIPESTSGAENVAYNYKTAKIVANGWIHSPGHRHNILGHYNLTGIGIIRDQQGRPYFTQLFLRTDNPPVVAHHRTYTYHPSQRPHFFIG